jgi:PAS domain S-box-containing protein
MRNYPLRIAVIYFLVAVLWIFLSDGLTQQLVPTQYLTTVQSIKGFAFVLVTSLILFWVTHYSYRKIRINEQNYRKLFKESPQPMYVFDTKTLKFLAVNNAAIAKYKYTYDEFRNMSLLNIRPPEEHEAILMFVKSLEDKPYHESGIWKHIDKNGKIFYVRIASHAAIFGNKNARVVVAFDIDEQIQAQRKARISESKLTGLINNTDDLIWMIDKDGLVVAVNDAFKDKFKSATGFELQLSKKIDVKKLPSTWIIHNWQEYMKDAFGGKKLRIEQEIETNGKKEWFEIILNPVVNDAGEVFSVGCFARDITGRKESEHQIKEQVSRLKEVAWIQSHEVRRPLANIMGLISLFRHSNKEEKSSAEMLDHMEQSCKDLDAVIKKVVNKSTTEDPS